jgi:hypothetical protein
MNLRAFEEHDQLRIAEIHAEMGLDYKMPDLSAEIVQMKTVIEHDGKVLAAGAAKIQPEIYLWVRPDATPAEKWDAIRMIHRDLVRQALKLGFEQLVCYVPNCRKFFSKRMKMLRWTQARDGWCAWVFELGAKP